MPKRKRSVADTVQTKLEKYRIDIFRALSSAKVFERKRFSTKLREPGITVAKKTRLEREYGVLKSLDLRLTARHHLHSNLLRIKAVETSEDIPEELRAEVPRPTLSPEEIALQNNVISILCSANSTRHALDRAITDICETLGVPVPTKSKRVRNKRKDTEEQPADREEDEDGSEEDVKPSNDSKKKKKEKKQETAEEESDSESEFEGFGSDADEPRPTIEELEGSDQETAVTKYDNLLGGSSDESEDEFDEEFLAKYRGTEQVNLDDISVSGSGSEAEDEDEEDLDSISGPRSPSPVPTRKPKKLTDDDDDDDEPKPEATKSEKEKKEEDKKKRAAKAALKTARPGDSTFLPTLMGGYISGSESASDIDAPPKKRRGQRARQAIWEKKYGAKAKHLQKQAASGGRDSGWDMKRGAVGPEDQGRKPWKKGGRALAGAGDRGGYSQGRERGANAHQESRPAPPPKPVKKDNEGPLHPSWEARKKAKEQQKGAAFAGSKIVFD
ncbi:hypothetical protein TGAMA5MH_10693 [Trichoderma gamsii]|uniref:Bud22 domain-containing protein n=1 Tax=Trichoderma gamsii TaxID=398673 RepID=A0A2K0SVW4_9HYPO|nr:hypothetical protein TGAMA5MH_10693 [Trichoderma gamsii]